MKMLKTFGIVITLCSMLILPVCKTSAAQTFETISFEQNIEQIFNKYSYYLDTKYNEEFQTWFFAAPTYDFPEWTFASDPRYLVSFATFYKYRALGEDQEAKIKISNAVRSAVFKQKIKAQKAHSFDGAITNFLIVRLLEQMPDLLLPAEKRMYQMELLYHMPIALQAQDTENRAALSGVYWYYVAKYLERNDLEVNQEIYDLINKKVEQSIIESVSIDFLYRENKQKDFSMHYHILEAYLLSIYGDWTKNINHVITGREMTKNFQYLTFKNGLLESAFGARPQGSNMQTYLMAGLLSKRFKYNDFNVYLQYLNNDRFFNDSKNPCRLAWYSTFEHDEKIYHDDYSFANIAELALASESFGQFEYDIKPVIVDSDIKINNKTFYIKNQGSKIQFLDKIKNNQANIQLSSYGLTTKPY